MKEIETMFKRLEKRFDETIALTEMLIRERRKRFKTQELSMVSPKKSPTSFASIRVVSIVLFNS